MMTSLEILNLLLVQAAQLAVVGGVAWCLWRCFAQDRPHLAHALWAIVLLKCITPPVVSSPISLLAQWTPWSSGAVEFVPQSPSRGSELSFSNSPRVHDELSTTVRTRPGVWPEELAAQNAVAESHTPWGGFAVAVLVAWGIGCGSMLVITASRLQCFLRTVRRQTIDSPPAVCGALDALKQQLGLRRNVRFRVIDGSLGPAVVGLWRPTIVLPKVLVEQQPLSHVRILLAHELIHIRRGDLCWATIQAMSLCIGWFHPMVWLAQRLLTREAERCCDEETIASLGCQPAMYARSLLDVLERKYALQAAPSLPGVRPVDVTSKRLERIMSLGQGCHARRPRWVAMLLLVGAAIALPGSAWGLPQKGPEEAPSRSPDGKTKATIGKMLPRANAAAWVKSQPAQPMPAQPSDGKTPVGFSLAERDGVDGFKLDIEVYEVPRSRLTRDEFPVEVRRAAGSISKPDRSVVTPAVAGSVRSDLGMVGHLVLAGRFPEEGFVLSDDQRDAFLNRLKQGDDGEADEQAKCINRPTLLVLNGRSGSVHIGSQVPLVTSYERVTSVDEPNAVAHQPVVTVFADGIGIDVTVRSVDTRDNDGAAAEKASAELSSAERVWIDFKLRQTKVQRVDDFELRFDGKSLTIQQPKLVSAFKELGRPMTLGKTLVVATSLSSDDGAENATVALVRCSRIPHDVKGEESSASPATAPDVAMPPEVEPNVDVPQEQADEQKSEAGNPKLTTRYDRIPILGPITARGPAVALDPPSDAEIVRAARKAAGQAGIELGFDLKDVDYVIKEKIADYVDPQKFVPLIGDASLHHAHYKCTLFDQETGLVEVVYVDHNHYHMTNTR